jgi:hypothetical protein
MAAARQLQPATLERVIRLIDILDAFGADTLIGPRIALKGGTALNVFHSGLDRLSIDIDVNYVGAVEKKQMDMDRPGLEDRIERLMESKGYTARREPSEHAGGKWIYRYDRRNRARTHTLVGTRKIDCRIAAAGGDGLIDLLADLRDPQSDARLKFKIALIRLVDDLLLSPEHRTAINASKNRILESGFPGLAHGDLARAFGHRRSHPDSINEAVDRVT